MSETRRGVVMIVRRGDPEIAGALAEGIERGMSRRTPAAAGISSGADAPPSQPGAALASEAVRRVAMHQHTPEEWATMTARARYEYGQRRPPSRLARSWWAAVGLIVYLLAAAYRAQDRVLLCDGGPRRDRGRWTA